MNEKAVYDCNKLCDVLINIIYSLFFPKVMFEFLSHSCF